MKTLRLENKILNSSKENRDYWCLLETYYYHRPHWFQVISWRRSWEKRQNLIKVVFPCNTTIGAKKQEWEWERRRIMHNFIHRTKKYKKLYLIIRIIKTNLMFRQFIIIMKETGKQLVADFDFLQLKNNTKTLILFDIVWNYWKFHYDTNVYLRRKQTLFKMKFSHIIFSIRLKYLNCVCDLILSGWL